MRNNEQTAPSKNSEPLHADPTVVLGYQHTLVRDGVAMVLASRGFDVVAEAGTTSELVDAARLHEPSLVLVGKDLFDQDPESIKTMAAELPSSATAVLAKPEPQDDISAMLQAGITGYLSVDLSSEEFERSLTLLANGDIVVSGHLAGELPSAEEADGASSAASLSEREMDVLALVGAGRTNREIAEQLVVTESTVKAHVRSVLDKLNLRNRQQAAAFAAREGIEPGEPVPEDEPVAD